MFSHRRSCKNSCYSELEYNSNVLVLIYLMNCSLRFKKDVFYLRNVSFLFDFVLLILKLSPIQVVISLPLWIKLTMYQISFFYAAYAAFLATSEAF